MFVADDDAHVVSGGAGTLKLNYVHQINATKGTVTYLCKLNQVLCEGIMASALLSLEKAY